MATDFNDLIYLINPTGSRNRGEREALTGVLHQSYNELIVLMTEMIMMMVMIGTSSVM